jgi:hypothetical protein
MTLSTPEVTGSHDLVLSLRVAGRQVAENRYPIHVVAEPGTSAEVRLLGEGPARQALERIGATIGETGPTVVAEGQLDHDTGRELELRLRRGETAVVLAQPPEARDHFPLPVALVPLGTAWGSSVFHFTTDHGGVPSLPRGTVLVAEDSNIRAAAVLARVADSAFTDTPVVIAYKPAPNAVVGTVVGAHQVGSGRAIFCQFTLCEPGATGDPAALALLGDLVRWAAVPRPRLHRRSITKEDGRALTYYRPEMDVAR